MRMRSCAILVLTAAVLGCEGPLPPPDTPAVLEDPTAPALAPAAAARDAQLAQPPEPVAQPTVPSLKAVPSPAAVSSPAVPGGDAGDSEKAAVGVGAKGRDYGGEGFVTTPVETFFKSVDRIAFDVQIPSNMKLYKAEHNNKGPKTHDEFMKVIIQDGGISLPELPQGDTYWYDPKTEELMVRHPPGQSGG